MKWLDLIMVVEMELHLEIIILKLLVVMKIMFTLLLGLVNNCF